MYSSLAGISNRLHGMCTGSQTSATTAVNTAVIIEMHEAMRYEKFATQLKRKDTRSMEGAELSKQYTSSATTATRRSSRLGAAECPRAVCRSTCDRFSPGETVPSPSAAGRRGGERAPGR